MWNIVTKSERKSYLVCKCDCGLVKEVRKDHLKSGKSSGCKSCSTTRRSIKLLTGQRFGRLLVLAHLGSNKQRKSLWLCLCDCKKTSISVTDKLKSGKTKSCGCLRVDVHTTHGLSKTKGYKSYMCRKRQSDKLKRTPKWADQEKIKEIYQNCPEGLTVDHIIPLKGKLVSGLHVENNFQYLSVEENSSKNNKYVPS